MFVLLFDIMEFGIVGGYLSKLCVTLPHMSIRLGGVFLPYSLIPRPPSLCRSRG